MKGMITMSTTISAYNLNNNNSSHNVSYEPITTCPCCKFSLNPINVSAAIYCDDAVFYLATFEYCPACKNTFISKYILTGYTVPHTNEPYKIRSTNGSHLFSGALISCEPNKFSKYVFDEKIISLSPQFDKIYNQALAAETMQLDEIAGLGYRKSLEFLIKDFAIHEHPDAESGIKSMNLSGCINTYIDDARIKTLAQRSTWIGNDEAHYVRKQVNRDVSDMKAFIQACVYFIGMVLITEDAASMTPKN